MKTLKKILYILLAVIILLLILAFVMPKGYEVSKSQEYKVPTSLAFNAVNDMTLQEKWNPWKAMDPDMKMEFSEITKGAGAQYTWTGPKSGSGTYKYIASDPNKSIYTEVVFDGMGEAKGQYLFEETEDGTKLTWTFNGQSGWPMNLMNFMATRAIGKSFKEGLKNLEPILNERSAGNYGGFAVKEIVVPERHFVMNRSEVKFENIGQFYAQNLGGLFQKIQKAGLEMNGMPCGLFFKYDIPNGVTDMAAAIPLKVSVDIPDASSYHTEERNALSIDFYGDYAGTEAAHDAIDAYMKDRGLLNDVPIVEEYVTDPASEPDPKKWLTKIYYYISQ